ncbi:hypothetical protein KQX54_020566 [Cotesia glomerata]|uniref:Uncharacterized protein n=1 Tax=Cotesia glomerata TaxID=32391 RepID=A0AAV7HM16_COTGL|nr:hypothetical protein KQX54_020566 [Cotesia glomerata]
MMQWSNTSYAAISWTRVTAAMFAESQRLASNPLNFFVHPSAYTLHPTPSWASIPFLSCNAPTQQLLRPHLPARSRNIRDDSTLVKTGGNGPPNDPHATASSRHANSTS